MYHTATLQNTRKTGEAPILSAFIHQANLLFAIAVLRSLFILSFLVNLFFQNVGYMVTTTTGILQVTLILLQGSPSSGLFRERRAGSYLFLSHFPSVLFPYPP